MIDAEIDGLTSANYAALITDLKAISLPAVDQIILKELIDKVALVAEADCGNPFAIATAKTAAKATLAEYDGAATTAATNLTDVQAINTAVKALTGVNSKADYDAAVEAVAVGGSSATADEMKAVQKAMKALVAGPGFVKPTAEAVLAVVRSFEDAKLAATEANTIATTVGTAVSSYAGNKAQVLAAINATVQSYYSTEEKAVVKAIHDAADTKTPVAEVIDAAVEKAAEYVGASADYVSLASNINKTDASKTTYLRVDTTYLTTVSSDKYQ